MPQTTELDQQTVTTHHIPDDPQFAALCKQGNSQIRAIINAQAPRVFIISGPSGVGKDAAIAKLQNVYPDARYVVTATTRSMRDNETDGVHYRFLDRDDFERKIEQGYFIEHEPVYENLYGVPKRPIVDGLASGQHVIVKVDVKGAKSLRKLIPEAVSIFLLPETMEALWQRLNDRKTEPFDVMLRRFGTACQEIERVDEFDYVVFNEDEKLTEALDNIVNIIEAEQRRVGQQDIVIS